MWVPDFSEIEREAKDHPQQVDEGISKLEQEADKDAGGRDHGLIDKGGAALERDLGDGDPSAQQPQQ